MLYLLNPKSHLLVFRELVGLLSRYRQLILEITKRELTDRFAGQVLGVFWTFGHPLALMAVYIFLFGVVFKMKVGGTRELPLDFTTYLLSGLIPWLAFADSMNKGTTSITGNANLVKQVVFPIEILPVKGVIASLFVQAVSTAFLCTYVLIKYGTLPWTYVLLPFLFGFQGLAMIGIGYILASVGAYFRDLKDFVMVFCLINIYILPIVFMPQMVPKAFRPILYINPFSYMIWCYQDACYFGRFEHPWAWAVFIFEGLFLFYFGYRIFRKLKLMFGNVL
jgi:lipopolysaccharide transport system permease protein